MEGRNSSVELEELLIARKILIFIKVGHRWEQLKKLLLRFCVVLSYSPRLCIKAYTVNTRGVYLLVPWRRRKCPTTFKKSANGTKNSLHTWSRVRCLDRRSTLSCSSLSDTYTHILNVLFGWTWCTCNECWSAAWRAVYVVAAEMLLIQFQF